MKRKLFLKTLIFLPLLSFLLTGCQQGSNSSLDSSLDSSIDSSSDDDIIINEDPLITSRVIKCYSSNSTYVTSYSPSKSFTQENFNIYGDKNNYRSLIKFSLGSYSLNRINDISLILSFEKDSISFSSFSPTIRYGYTKWNIEDDVNWNNKTSYFQWSKDNEFFVSSSNVEIVKNEVDSVHFNSLLFSSLSLQNNDINLEIADSNNVAATFYSSNYADKKLRPYLDIDYSFSFKAIELASKWKSFRKEDPSFSSFINGNRKKELEDFYIDYNSLLEEDLDIFNLNIDYKKGEKDYSLSDSISSIRKYLDLDLNGVYFSSKGGKDGDGTRSNPYNNLNLINENFIKEKGNIIYIESGSEFILRKGLTLKDINLDSQVVITSFGEGDKPKLIGESSASNVLILQNCSNIKISNLEIYNKEKESEGNRRGIYIHVTKNSKISNVTISNCYVHDILGYSNTSSSISDSTMKKTGGIYIEGDENSSIDTLNIINNEISNVGNVGIASRSNQKYDGAEANPYHSSFESTSFKNVRVAYNSIHDIAKNAIFLRNLFGGVVESNVVYNTSTKCVDGGNSIVTARVKNTIIQYNEGYKNGNSSSAKDGAMLDADLYSLDTIWQYNYSHDNAFGLFINCTNKSDNVTVRFNLSVNDMGNRGIICLNYAFNKIDIYNNTIISGTGSGLSVGLGLLLFEASVNATGKANVFNNIFYCRSENVKTSVPSSLNDINFYCNAIFDPKGEYKSPTLSTLIPDIDSHPLIKNADPNFINTDYSSLNGYEESVKKFAPIRNKNYKAYAFAISNNFVDILGNSYSKTIGCYFLS